MLSAIEQQGLFPGIDGLPLLAERRVSLGQHVQDVGFLMAVAEFAEHRYGLVEIAERAHVITGVVGDVAKSVQSRSDGLLVAVPTMQVQGNGHDSAGEARVLVVDDEPPIAELVTTALRFEGFDVTSAPDGQAALRAVVSFRRSCCVGTSSWIPLHRGCFAAH